MAKKTKQLSPEELGKIAQKLVEAPIEKVQAIKEECINGFYGEVKPKDNLRRRLRGLK